MNPTDASQPNGVRYFIVADDLTGACDSAVAFTGRGMKVEVLLHPESDRFQADVCAVSTESRDIERELAAMRVREALQTAPEACEVFKKIDSVMRGNSLAEIQAALECYPCDLAVMSPAYPALGRTMKGGLLSIDNGTHKQVINIVKELRKTAIGDALALPADQTVKSAASLMRDAMRARSPLVLCDAESEVDLQTAVTAARSLGGKILWVGSGGLAHALAHDLPQVITHHRGEANGGRLLLFVGSDHEVTKRQVAALKQATWVQEIDLEVCGVRSPEAQVLVLNVLRASTTEAQVLATVKSLADKGIRACVLTGGDTAALVLRSLGVGSIRLTGQFAPGLAMGIAQGGVLDGITVILKSGGFGSRDVLCRIADRFTGGREAV
ncbi:MAG TPA: four-carbon acid sugar kinase family protein [Edaphobacter sp.]|nr:four-carbon acid sugar kinase family protein [Edaphobacter sp.]